MGIAGIALLAASALAIIAPSLALADAAGNADLAHRLIAAYPDALDRLDGNDLVFKNGTRLPFDDGGGAKSFADLLTHADIKDQFAFPYPSGAPIAAPAENVDPGRIRNAPFFKAMYGDCAKGQVERKLVAVPWLKSKGGGVVKVTSVNGVAKAVASVSAELDALPPAFDRYLLHPAGTYNCRPIAGTAEPSMHGTGAAIDIDTRYSDYWRWSQAPLGKAGRGWRNRIPAEIVAIFERHGFVWGGRWSHYDTMHFEYRPELVMPAPAAK